jgi:hypothetical protein
MKSEKGLVAHCFLRFSLVPMSLLLICSGMVWAQSELIIYPSKGQSQQQMEKDKSECYNWARQQSGFDPMAPPTASTPPPAAEAPKGGVAKGAVRGGVVGLAVGAIAGDAGEGAAIGAASGALIGGMRRRDQVSQQEQAQKQWEQQESARYTQGRNEYNRAFSACMEGRDYTVK